ncbi:hypothetical protein ACVDFE_14405 [Lentzea chajnantorensis]
MPFRTLVHAAAVAVLVLLGGTSTAVAGPELDGCVPADLRGGAVAFRAADDLELTGLMLGGGPKGVLLVPGVTDGFCDWLPLARHFEDDGYQVLLLQARTEVLDLGKSFRFDHDVVAAAQELERRGVTSLMAGAGTTGATALAAVAADVPRLHGMFLLSPLERVAMGGNVLDAAAGLEAFDGPVFLAAAEDDGVGLGGGREVTATGVVARLGNAALFSTVKTVPGSAQGARLADGPVRADLLAFVRETVPPPGFPLWLPVVAVALVLLLVPAVMLVRGRRAVRRLPDLGGARIVELGPRP